MMAANHAHHDPAAGHDLIDELADDFLTRQQRGEHPSLEEYCCRYPELAEEIRELFPTLNILRDVQSKRRKVDIDSPRLPKMIGGYRIHREIGRGGMGIVYQAEQVSLRRLVALKVLPHRWFNDQTSVARFQTEAQATAKLHHTNIVPVYEVGEEDGQFFFAMQLINGRSLDAVIRDQQQAFSESVVESLRPLPSGSNEIGVPSSSADTSSKEDSSTLERSGSIRMQHYRWIARIGLQAADALDYAHRRSIIHRDIKPSNLLLDESGVVWVTDFGLAKVDDANLTNTGDYLGTLRYMSPERFRGDCDPRADIYAIGLTLYELLLFRPAFMAVDGVELIDQITRSDPPRPRTVDPRVPRDLETIILKAIDREPDKRYESAGAMADDLRRFIEDRPIQARRQSVRERFTRWCLRNRQLAASLFTIAFLAVALVIGSLVAATHFHAQREEQKRLAAERTAEADRARSAEDTIQQNLYGAHMRLASEALWESGGVGRALELTDRWDPAHVGKDLRGWEWYFVRSYSGRELIDCQVTDGPPVQSVDWNPDGTRFASSTPHGSIFVWDAESGAKRKTLDVKGQTLCVRWSPDGTHLAAAHGQSVSIWDLTTGQVMMYQEHRGICRSIAWNPQGTRLASVSPEEGQIKVWVTNTGDLYSVLEHEQTPYVSVEWSVDGSRLAAGGRQNRVHVWDLNSGEVVLGWQEPGSGEIEAISWSPDGRNLAAVDNHHGLFVWDCVTGVQDAVYYSRANLHSIAWHPDGQRIAIGGWDGIVRVLDAKRLWERRVLFGHVAQVWDVRWSPDGTKLASASSDGHVRVWSGGRQLRNDSRILATLEVALSSVAWSPDRQQLAVVGSTDDVFVWDSLTDDPRRFSAQDRQLSSVDWSSSGRQLATSSQAGNLQIWDVATGETKHEVAHDGPLSALSWSPSRNRLAAAGNNGISIWDPSNGELVRTLAWDNVMDVAWSPHGKQLAAANVDGSVTIWSPDGELVRVLRGHKRSVRCVRWSPDGAQIASCGLDRTIRIWEATIGRQVAAMRGHTRTVQAVCWSPDGRRLASASRDRTVRIWNSATGTEVLSINGHENAVSDVTWSPDGHRIASTSEDKTVRIWDATRAYRQGTLSVYADGNHRK